MDIRQIKYFLCVAEEKSISNAAKKLHISQPPLSRQIMALEEEFGVDLFLRTNSGMVLTEAGLLLQRFSLDLESLFDTVVNEMKALSSSGVRERTIIIGANDASKTLVVPVFSELFLERFNGYGVASLSRTVPEITDKMQLGEIDIGFVRAPFSHMDKFDIHKIHAERWIAVFCKNNNKSGDYGGEDLDIETLSQYPLILPSRESLYLPLVDAFIVRDKKPEVPCYYFELAKGVDLVKNGIGVAILPECVKHMVSMEDVIVRNISDLKQDLFLAAIKLKGNSKYEFVNRFWEMIQEYDFKMPSHGTPRDGD